MGSTEQTGPGKVTLSSTAMWSLSWLLSLLLLQTAQGSLMSRIGLRLGAAHLKKSALDHKPRTPWAVRNMKEEMLANERKPWQPPRQRQFSDNEEEESRPKACVGICYYNKLMALEAKEDLASHNLVYKDQKEEPCDNENSACDEMEEDIIFNTDQQQQGNSQEKSSDNNVIVIDEDDQAAVRRKSSGAGDMGSIYIDDSNEENSVENPSIDISLHG